MPERRFEPAAHSIEKVAGYKQLSVLPAMTQLVTQKQHNWKEQQKLQ